MNLTLADIYYIKALDEYPYTLESVIENLNYALSYDPEHVAANCLMGRLYQEQLGDLETAEHYLQNALAADPGYAEAYIQYTMLAINLYDTGKAEKLIGFARNLRGINKAWLFYLEGLLFEQKRDYCKATNSMKDALLEAFDENIIKFIKAGIERIQEKMDSTRTINYEIK